jgi:hypothetical protein
LRSAAGPFAQDGSAHVSQANRIFIKISPKIVTPQDSNNFGAFTVPVAFERLRSGVKCANVTYGLKTYVTR